MKIDYCDREVKVLFRQFQEVQAMFQALKLDDSSLPQPSSSDKFAELISTVSKLRIEAAQSFHQKQEELNQISRDVDDLKLSGDNELHQLDLEIADLKQKLEVETLQNMKLEEELTGAEDECSTLQNEENILKLKIQSQEEELETLDRKSKEINDLYGTKIKEKKLRIEKLVGHNKVLEERKKNLKETFDAKKAALIESNKMKAATVEELEQCQKAMSIKEKNILDLKARIASQENEIKELKLKTACEKDLEKELEMLKEDVKAANDKKQILEKELSNYSKVHQQKAASDEEKINLISRLQLLREKDQSYAEDLESCNQRLKESEVKEAEIDAKIKDIESENKILVENIEIRKTCLEDVKKNCSDLEEEELQLRKTLEELKKNQQVRESNIEKLSFEREMLVKSLKDVNEKLTIVGKEKESTSAEIESMENDLEAAETKIADLQIQLSNVEEENKSMNLKFEKLSIEVQEKEAEENEVVSKITLAKETLVALDETVSSLQEKISAKTDVLKDLEAKKKDLYLSLENLKVEKSSKEELIKSQLSIDTNVNKEKILSLEEELKKNQTEVDKLRTDEEEIVKKIELVNDTIQSQKSSLEKVQLENRQIEEEIKVLNSNKKDLEMKVKNFCVKSTR